MEELETQSQMERTAIASYLRDLADQLEGDGEVTLELGGTQVTLEPTEPVTFKLEGESDWSEGDPQAKQSIEFEMVWWRDVTGQAEASLATSEQST